MGASSIVVFPSKNFLHVWLDILDKELKKLEKLEKLKKLKRVNEIKEAQKSDSIELKD